MTGKPNLDATKKLIQRNKYVASYNGAPDGYKKTVSDIYFEMCKDTDLKVQEAARDEFRKVGEWDYYHKMDNILTEKRKKEDAEIKFRFEKAKEHRLSKSFEDYKVGSLEKKFAGLTDFYEAKEDGYYNNLEDLVLNELYINLSRMKENKCDDHDIFKDVNLKNKKLKYGTLEKICKKFKSDGLYDEPLSRLINCVQEREITINLDEYNLWELKNINDKKITIKGCLDLDNPKADGILFKYLKNTEIVLEKTIDPRLVKVKSCNNSKIYFKKVPSEAKKEIGKTLYGLRQKYHNSSTEQIIRKGGGSKVFGPKEALIGTEQYTRGRLAEIYEDSYRDTPKIKALKTIKKAVPILCGGSITLLSTVGGVYSTYLAYKDESLCWSIGYIGAALAIAFGNYMLWKNIASYKRKKDEEEENEKSETKKRKNKRGNKDTDISCVMVEPEKDEYKHVCPSCGSPVDAAAKRCSECGEKLDESDEYECPTCGAKVGEKDKKCCECGEQFE